jgi:hypothetical protein
MDAMNEPTGPRERPTRPTVVRALGLLALALGTMGVCIGSLLIVRLLHAGHQSDRLSLPSAGLSLLLEGALLLGGMGTLLSKRWGRILLVGYAVAVVGVQTPMNGVSLVLLSGAGGDPAAGAAPASIAAGIGGFALRFTTTVVLLLVLLRPSIRRAFD